MTPHEITQIARFDRALRPDMHQISDVWLPVNAPRRNRWWLWAVAGMIIAAVLV